MQTTDNHEQLVIDRMVDGELSESERRNYLQSLDQQPDGWRLLALAFAEAQTWRQSFREATGPATVVPARADASGVTTTDITPGGRSWRSIVLRGPALLVCLMAVFAIGLFSSDRWNDNRYSHNRTIPAERPQTGRQQFHNDREQHVNAVRESLKHKMPRIPDPGLHDTTTFHLPVIPVAQQDMPSLASPRPIIDPALRAQLQRLGHIVTEEQRVYPIELQDGRRILIPVNDFTVRYVGNKVYQ